MMLDRWSPFIDVGKTLEEMDRMFGRVGRPLGLRSVPRGTFPAINVYAQDDAVVVVAELPGVKAEDLDLSVLNDSLTLKGERADEPPAEGDRYYRRERMSGAFARTINLPDPVDPDSVRAEYKNGVLKIHMAKAQEARAKKIAIQS